MKKSALAAGQLTGLEKSRQPEQRNAGGTGFGNDENQQWGMEGKRWTMEPACWALHLLLLAKGLGRVLIQFPHCKVETIKVYLLKRANNSTKNSTSLDYYEDEIS